MDGHQEAKPQGPVGRIGFFGAAAAGVALVALVAAGWTLGGTDGAGEESAETPASVSAPGAAVDEASPHGAPEVTADPMLERLRSDLAAAPDRLDLRKQLAIELLRRAQFYPAFDEAERILAQEPDDVDGLFVTAAIRVRMGQPSRALPLLERVLEQVPGHVPALTAKGQALLETGHPETAFAVWTRALELSGGRNAQVEEMLRSLPSGTAAPHPVAEAQAGD